MNPVPGLAVAALAWRVAAYPLYGLFVGLAWVFHPRGNPARLLVLILALLVLRALG